MKIGNLVFFIGACWLAASFWLSNYGDPKYVWAALLPAVYISLLTLLRE